MYVIMVYDFSEKRVAKMLKLSRKYLNWIQNSVFEGEITEAKFMKMELEVKRFIRKDEDSLIVFKSRNERWLQKVFLGKDEGFKTDRFF